MGLIISIPAASGLQQQWMGCSKAFPRRTGDERAERLIRSGHIGIIFMELNWAKSAGATCAAAESIRPLEQGGYRFSRAGKRLNWQKAGDWLRTPSDVVAHRARP